MPKLKTHKGGSKAFSLDSIGQIQTRPQPRASYLDQEDE